MRTQLSFKNEYEAKRRALKILEQERLEKRKRESIDLFPERYRKGEEGRRIYSELLKQGALNDDFEEIYFGWFKSKDAFALSRLHGKNGLCFAKLDYRDYADQIFKDQFVFVNGHVFWK